MSLPHSKSKPLHFKLLDGAKPQRISRRRIVKRYGHWKRESVMDELRRRAELSK